MNNIDWKNLPFGYLKTNSNIRCYWKDGKWGDLEVSDSEYINLHMAATSLHYGQEAFEGTKAFRGKDNKIRLFRCADNSRRMQSSADYVKMVAPGTDLFVEAIKKAVSLNTEFVPPYESGASLYIRPLLIGSGPQVGVKPATEFLFLVFVTPVGPYFKEGFKPVDIVIERDTDRAAPLGTGHVKVGGNYAASLSGQEKAHKSGFSTVLYLDSREKKYIDECGPANFFAIKNNTYVTPESKSILPSITNMSLMTLAAEMGMKVERRRIPVDELESFEEVGACGTAAVISPINKIVDLENNRIFQYCKNSEPGPVSTKLYQMLRAIQYGDVQDKYNWVTVLD